MPKKGERGTPRTRDQSMRGCAGLKLEVQRSLRVAAKESLLRDDFQRAKARGWLLPNFRDAEALEFHRQTIRQGIAAGLLSYPNGHDGGGGTLATIPEWPKIGGLAPAVDNENFLR